LKQLLLATLWLIALVLAIASAHNTEATHTNVVAVDVGGAASCAETFTGSVYCWGSNTLGIANPAHLGFGSESDPAQIQNLPLFQQLEVGTAAACVLTNAGGLVCWGSRKTGPNEYTLQSAPFTVSGYESGVDALAVGANTTCVVKTDATVSCTIAEDYEFAPVCLDSSCTAFLSSVDALAVGSHSCAVVAGGVKCWGQNNAGQLGDGTTADSAYPVDVCEVFASQSSLCLQPLTGVESVAVGGFHSCALKITGSVFCWGDSEPGQISGISGAIKISVGAFFACALLDSGEVWCWGNNALGQLGNGTIDSTIFTPTPTNVVDLPDSVVDIDIEGSHTCALGSSGDVYCWGRNQESEIGLPAGGVFPSPRLIVQLSHDADSDGTPDSVDACPNLPGPVANSGCASPTAVGGSVELRGQQLASGAPLPIIQVLLIAAPAVAAAVIARALFVGRDAH
jgi:alpha-tubulin suppressor-like RCC1 family protein